MCQGAATSLLKVEMSLGCMQTAHRTKRKILIRNSVLFLS